MYIVCVFAGVCTGKYTPEYTYVWRTDVKCLLPPLTSNFSPLRQGLSWTWSSLIKIDRLVRKLRDLSLTHQCQDYTGTCHCTHQLLLMWGGGLCEDMCTTCMQESKDARRGCCIPWNSNYSCESPCGCWNQTKALCKSIWCSELLSQPLQPYQLFKWVLKI